MTIRTKVAITAATTALMLPSAATASNQERSAALNLRGELISLARSQQASYSTVDDLRAIFSQLRMVENNNPATAVNVSITAKVGNFAESPFPDLWDVRLGSTELLSGLNSKQTKTLEELATNAPSISPWINYGKVLQATSADPVSTATLLGTGRAYSFQIPSGATPSMGSNHDLAVINSQGTAVHEMWEATQTGPNRWTALYVANELLDGSGFGKGITASGASIIAGMVRTGDIKSGSIDHALALCLSTQQVGYGYVWPATSNGSAVNYSGDIPMGARVAIPKSVNINGLGIRTSGGLIIANALQSYGGYVVDSCGQSTMAITVQQGAIPSM